MCRDNCVCFHISCTVYIFSVDISYWVDSNIHEDLYFQVQLPLLKFDCVSFLKKYDVLSNRYLENHDLHQLNDTPNLDYLGHPINAYHFIRHVASGWKRILNDGPQINNWIQKNAGKIVWNNLSNDIGNLKTCVAIN